MAQFRQMHSGKSADRAAERRGRLFNYVYWCREISRFWIPRRIRSFASGSGSRISHLTPESRDACRRDDGALGESRRRASIRPILMGGPAPSRTQPSPAPAGCRRRRAAGPAASRRFPWSTPRPCRVCHAWGSYVRAFTANYGAAECRRVGGQARDRAVQPGAASV